MIFHKELSILGFPNSSFNIVRFEEIFFILLIHLCYE